MWRGLVIFLLLMGVGGQALPLRVCVVEQTLVGRSCHDQDGPIVQRSDAPFVVDNGLHDHTAADGESDRTCRCEMPKGGVNRHVSPDAPVDLLPANAAPVELSLVLASAVFIPTIEQPPKVAAASVNLPLLI
jgi:hypothetical protein